MSITDRSAASTDPIEQTVQFGRIAAAIEYLYDHAADQPTLAQVSQAVHVSPEYLQRQFQQWAGVSPKKMLQHISLERAKAALAGQQSTLDAAWSSGFSGTGRLHDAFVTIEGMTPGEYKNGGANLRIIWRYAASPFGMVLIAATDKGICHMAFADNPDAALTNLRAEYPNAQLHEGEHPFHEQALSIFGGGGECITLHLKGTPFQVQVWRALLNIPQGSVQSYGSVAESIGRPRAARAVGTAVGHNPVAMIIPCHRVIRESGVIGDYRWGRGRKMALLAQELGAA